MCWTISTDMLSPCTGEWEIKALKVKCNNYRNGCAWVGELRSLDNHLTTWCGYILLRCTNECMENKKELRMLRRDLDNHLKNKCPKRQYQCPHCKVTGRYCDITTSHLDTCQKLKIPCPNIRCNVKVSRCELSDHQSKCQFEKVLCKYAGIGCKVKPLRKDSQQHENDDTFHLHLAIETVNKQQKELEAFKEEQKRMNDTIMADQAGRCVLKMPEFDQHKSSKDVWYSPPFYIYPGSYKMCIRVDANGNDEGAGTYVSVYAYLMKGRDDDNLPWPFTGKVTVTMLNQLEDKNHHTETVSFPPDTEDSDISGRVVDSERAPTGYGWHEFISHDQLGYDAVEDCQYLKDDCLYFQIEAEADEPEKTWLTCTA